MILEAIRKEIEKGYVTRYQISKATGVNESVLHRIVNGGSCSIPTADLICDYLGLELQPKSQNRKRKVKK